MTNEDELQRIEGLIEKKKEEIKGIKFEKEFKFFLKYLDLITLLLLQILMKKKNHLWLI